MPAFVSAVFMRWNCLLSPALSSLTLVSLRRKNKPGSACKWGIFLSVYYGADAKVLAAGDLRFFHDRGDVVISPILARYPAIPISEAGLLWCTGYSVQSTDEWH
jgi:hypothetical protein